MKKNILLGLLFAVALAGCKGNTDAPQKRASAAPAEIVTAVSAESAPGAKQSNLDQGFLEYCEKILVETFIKKAMSQPQIAQKYSREDYEKRMKRSASYIEAGGKKLAVLKLDLSLKDNKEIYTTYVLGLDEKRSELKTVTCTSSEAFPVQSGKCGEAVEQAFGVKLSAK